MICGLPGHTHQTSVIPARHCALDAPSVRYLRDSRRYVFAVCSFGAPVDAKPGGSSEIMRNSGPFA
jgi:hypothetical protein